MDISERIKEIRSRFCDGSNVRFAEKMDENTNTTSGWASGKRGIGNSVIQKILNKFPEVSASWLLTGEGDMLNSNIEDKDPESEEEKRERLIKELDPTLGELLKAIGNLTEQGKINADANLQNALSNERNSRNIERLIILLEESLKAKPA